MRYPCGGGHSRSETRRGKVESIGFSRDFKVHHGVWPKVGPQTVEVRSWGSQGPKLGAFVGFKQRNEISRRGGCQQ